MYHYWQITGCLDIARRSDCLREVITSYNKQLQALAFQRAFWGIACLVLLPSPCSDSSLYLSFRNVCKATSVTHTKRICRNLLRKETSFVCYTSSVLIQIESIWNLNDWIWIRFMLRVGLNIPAVTNYLKQNDADYPGHLSIENWFEVERNYINS